MLLLGGIALFVATALVAGPLPGDIPMTRAVQGVVPPDAAWTAHLSNIAQMPWLAGAIAASALLVMAMAGWRGLLLLAAGVVLALSLDAGLRAILYVPRPSPDLVAVVAPSDSSGLPSTFALRIGAVVGVPMLLALSQRRVAIFVPLVLLLVAGLLARVAPGAHWPSQVLASWALLLPAIALMMRPLRILPRK